jgi:hypothetical protein
MKSDTAGLTHGCYFGDRLHYPDLIVRHHDRHYRRIVANDPAQSLDIDESGGGYRQYFDSKSVCTKVAHRLEDAFVLRRARHNVIATPLWGPGNPLQCNVVCFRRTGREDYLFRPSSDQLCNLSAGVFDSQFCAAAGYMLRMGITYRIHP